MKYNINNPPHLVANAFIRAIEGYLWQDGVGVKFGEEGHSLVEDFVHEYNREIERYYDEVAKLDIENQELKRAFQAIANIPESEFEAGRVKVLCVRALRGEFPGEES